MEFLKCVTIGDAMVGKTSMFRTYTEEVFPTENYIPTVFDNFIAVIKEEGREILLQLWDTSGLEEYDKLRSLSYPNMDVVLICFSIVRPMSLENVENRWIKEVCHFFPKPPAIILVGTHLDLRDDKETLLKLNQENLRPIDYNEGQMMAEKIGACKYLECSALTGEGLQIVFEEAVLCCSPNPFITRRVLFHSMSSGNESMSSDNECT